MDVKTFLCSKIEQLGCSCEPTRKEVCLHAFDSSCAWLCSALHLLNRSHLANRLKQTVNKRIAKISKSGIAIVSMLHGFFSQRLYQWLLFGNSWATCSVLTCSVTGWSCSRQTADCSILSAIGADYIAPKKTCGGDSPTCRKVAPQEFCYVNFATVK